MKIQNKRASIEKIDTLTAKRSQECLSFFSEDQKDDKNFFYLSNALIEYLLIEIRSITKRILLFLRPYFFIHHSHNRLLKCSQPFLALLHRFTFYAKIKLRFWLCTGWSKTEPRTISKIVF